MSGDEIDYGSCGYNHWSWCFLFFSLSGVEGGRCRVLFFLFTKYTRSSNVIDRPSVIDVLLTSLSSSVTRYLEPFCSLPLTSSGSFCWPNQPFGLSSIPTWHFSRHWDA